MVAFQKFEVPLVQLYLAATSVNQVVVLAVQQIPPSVQVVSSTINHDLLSNSLLLDAEYLLVLQQQRRQA